jgi:hypothetical protein
MAAVSSLSLGGQQSGANNERALFLKVFSGEVLAAYERSIKISPMLTTRTITSGKSAQFPTTGVAAARYFTPGADLLEDSSADSNAYLSNIKQSERVIYIDDLLTASCFIDQLDEAMSHYDYRSAFASELGSALARHQDNLALHTLAASAYNVNNQAGEQTPGASHTPVTASAFYSTPATAMDAIYDSARKLDEADIPRDGRFVIMPPIAYYNLLKAGVLSIGMHATSDSRKIDGTGVRGEASGTMIAGMPVIVSNVDGFTSSDSADDAGPITDTKGGGNEEHEGVRNFKDAPANDGVTAVPDGDNGDARAQMSSKLACLVVHPSSAGVVKLKDITMESEYLINRQGTLMVAKMAQGMGALRNDAVVAINTD